MQTPDSSLRRSMSRRRALSAPLRAVMQRRLAARRVGHLPLGSGMILSPSKPLSAASSLTACNSPANEFSDGSLAGERLRNEDGVIPECSVVPCLCRPKIKCLVKCSSRQERINDGGSGRSVPSILATTIRRLAGIAVARVMLANDGQDAASSQANQSSDAAKVPP